MAEQKNVIVGDVQIHPEVRPGGRTEKRGYPPDEIVTTMGKIATAVEAGGNIALIKSPEDTIWWPVNLTGMVSKTDLTVPHSEVAMHSQAAGKGIICFVYNHKDHYGIAVWMNPDGTCGTIHGLPQEVLSEGLRDAVGKIRGY